MARVTLASFMHSPHLIRAKSIDIRLSEATVIMVQDSCAGQRLCGATLDGKDSRAGGLKP